MQVFQVRRRGAAGGARVAALSAKRIFSRGMRALRVSGDVFAQHQEHLTVVTLSGSIHTSCCRLVSWMSFQLIHDTSRQQLG